MKLETARFLFKIVRIPSVIGIALTMFQLLLLYNLGMDLKLGLLGLGTYLACFYIAQHGIDVLNERIDKTKGKNEHD